MRFGQFVAVDRVSFRIPKGKFWFPRFEWLW